MRLVISQTDRTGVVASHALDFREIEISNIAVLNQVVDCEEGVPSRVGNATVGAASLDPDVEKRLVRMRKNTLAAPATPGIVY